MASRPISLGGPGGLRAAGVPPHVLYYCTSAARLPAVLIEGLQMVGDQRIILWPTIEQAKQAAAQRGKPIVLHVQAAQLYLDGTELYLADDGSWHTEHVPIEYFQI